MPGNPLGEGAGGFKFILGSHGSIERYCRVPVLLQSNVSGLAMEWPDPLTPDVSPVEYPFINDSCRDQPFLDEISPPCTQSPAASVGSGNDSDFHQSNESPYYSGPQSTLVHRARCIEPITGLLHPEIPTFTYPVDECRDLFYEVWLSQRSAIAGISNKIMLDALNRVRLHHRRPAVSFWAIVDQLDALFPVKPVRRGKSRNPVHQT